MKGTPDNDEISNHTAEGGVVMVMDVLATIATQVLVTTDHEADVVINEIIAEVVTALWKGGVHAPVINLQCNDRELDHWTTEEVWKGASLIALLHLITE